MYEPVSLRNCLFSGIIRAFRLEVIGLKYEIVFEDRDCFIVVDGTNISVSTELEDKAIMSDLSYHSNWKVRRAVAKNPHTPPEILGMLAKSNSSFFQLTILRNPNTDAKTLHTLVERSLEVDRNLKNFANEEDLTGSLDLSSEFTCINAARHPNVAVKTLELLGTNCKYSVLYEVVRNDKTPSETLALIDRSILNGDQADYALAQHPNLPVEFLHNLAKHGNFYVRLAVAKNPNTAPETLLSLYNDVVEEVRQAVYKNLGSDSFLDYVNYWIDKED